MEEADLGVQTLWHLFYHRSMSIEELAENLGPHLQPDHVTVAIGSFNEAMQRIPGSGSNVLNEDETRALAAETVMGAQLLRRSLLQRTKGCKESEAACDVKSSMFRDRI